MSGFDIHFCEGKIIIITTSFNAKLNAANSISGYILVRHPDIGAVTQSTNSMQTISLPCTENSGDVPIFSVNLRSYAIAFH
jgi:hypothetical protein